MSTADNKQLVEHAFEAWADDQQDFFELLADDVRWTIPGSSPIAGVYASRREFLDQTIRPLSARLRQPIQPVLGMVIGEGDTVVALWEGHAVAKDDQPYDNAYCWVMRFEDGKIRDAIAYFDAPPLSDLWDRIPAGDGLTAA